MGDWGERWDPELSHKEEPVGRVTVNFKKISTDVDEIIDGTVTINDKHPKDELIKEWVGVGIAMFVLLTLSYQVLCIATVPFMVFYFIALIKIAKAWKFFKYNVAVFWIINVVALVAFAILGYFIRGLVL